MSLRYQWSLAPSFSALEADVAAQLAPVRGISGRSSGRIGIAMPSPGIFPTLSTPAAGTPSLVGVGVGKRRWYATIFSVDRPMSRSSSAERRSRTRSRAGSTPRSSPWPCPADRWSSRAPPPFHSGKPAAGPAPACFPPKPWCIEHARVLAVPRRGPRRIKSSRLHNVTPCHVLIVSLLELLTAAARRGRSRLGRSIWSPPNREKAFYRWIAASRLWRSALRENQLPRWSRP